MNGSEDVESASETLQEAVQRVLRDKIWSLRDAETATGVNYNTIKSMADGRKVGAEFVIRFAIGADEDPIAWLLKLDIDLRPFVRKYADRVREGSQRVSVRPGDEVEIISEDDGNLYRVDNRDTNAIRALLDALRRPPQ